MNKSYLTSRIPDSRYPVLKRASIFLTAGSLIAILETFIAIYIGIHWVPFKDAVIIGVSVLSMTALLIVITYFKKNLLVWHEWAVFAFYAFVFLTGYCLWIYRLGEIRLLALINALTIIAILLSYTTIIQSIMISIAVLTCYLTVSWYSITIDGQPGSLLKESFFASCLIPSFFLIAATANYINKKRKNLQQAKTDLEKLNFELTDANDKLMKEQIISEVEMTLAKEIQNAIFPGKAPQISDWDISFLTKPYGSVTGDFYDFYCSGNSLNGVSLFDVSGHGVAPALITILAKPVFYNHFNILKSSRLGIVLEKANSDLLKELEAVSIYITGIILRMNGSDVEYVNAGHPDLLHYIASEKKVSVVAETFDSVKGHPIGIGLSTKDYSSFEFKVTAGDFLIIYSDGLTESKNSSGEQFGLERLSDAIDSSGYADAAELLEHIMKALNDFTGDVKAGDDITLIIAGKK